MSWLRSSAVVVCTVLFFVACSSASEPVPSMSGSDWTIIPVDVVSTDSDAGVRADAGSVEVTPCDPKCQGKECGDDGCGGQCGECTGDDTCGSNGKCVCLPKCGGKECGSNGCGGLCGKCMEGELCQTGNCEPAWECTTLEECLPYVCDPDSGKCAPCQSDAHCAPAGLVCEPLTGLCVECVLDQDCSPFHNCLDHQCVALPPCQTDTDCGEGQVCDPDTGQCFQCTIQCVGKDCGSDGCGGQCGSCLPVELCVEDQCQEPAACAGPEDCAPFVCDPATGKCAKCTDDGQCADGTVCDVADGECVACITDEGCQPLHQCVDKECEPLPPCGDQGQCPSGMICDVENGVCVPCAPQCQGKTCGPDACGGMCGLCADNETCSGGVCLGGDCSAQECFPLVCNPETGECTSCEDSDQCGPPWLCDPVSGECVACVSDGDCPGGQQCIDGECAPPPPCQSNEDCPEGKECDTQSGVCGGCLPKCTNKTCGPDGCGGLCGDCGDNGSCHDGACVTGFYDANSGLVWQNPPSDGLYNQDEAKDYCDNLEWGDSTEWFLPDFEQLKTILSGAAIEGCHWQAGLNGQCGWYWSSTHQPDSNNDYYAINFIDQDVDPTDESASLRVRCARFAQ